MQWSWLKSLKIVKTDNELCKCYNIGYLLYHGPSCVKGRWGYPQDKLLLMDSIVHLLTLTCWIAIYSVDNTICILNNWALIFMQFLWIPCSIFTALHPRVHWTPFFVFVSLFVCFVFCSFVLFLFVCFVFVRLFCLFGFLRANCFFLFLFPLIVEE